MRLRNALLYLVFVVPLVAASGALGLEAEIPQYASFDPSASYAGRPDVVGAYPGLGTYDHRSPTFPRPGEAPGLLKPPVEGFNFDDNSTYGNELTIPPDPSCAAGIAHVVTVGNRLIQWREKQDPTAGVHTESLKSLFSGLPAYPDPGNTLGTETFDPKVIYDSYDDRFVVVALEKWAFPVDPINASRILVAVSKTTNPNDGWWLHSIDSRSLISGVQTWADYPGLAAGEDAVYVTANMFPFAAGSVAHRMWLIDKSPTYAGPDNSIVFKKRNPIGATGGTIMTMMPAQMFGLPPAASNGQPLGTYLIGYNGLTTGGPGADESVQVIEVTNPTGTPQFKLDIVDAGDIEDVGGVFGFPDFPDAPQVGGPALIDTGDRRLLGAVWRGDGLYAVASIVPNSGEDTTQVTTHWWRIDTADKDSLVMADQGNVGAEDLGPETFTFWANVMVDCDQNVAIGFAASNGAIHPGAYYATRFASEPPGTVGATGVLAAGVDYYERSFGSYTHRWGDYSGLAICPVDQSTFYIFNEYAGPRGTPTTYPYEDGRWQTKLGCFRLKEPVAVAITSFEATARGGGVDLAGAFVSDLVVSSINVYRRDDDAKVVRIAQIDDEIGHTFRYRDEDVQAGHEYTYRIGVVDPDGELLSRERIVTVPVARVALYQNAPNPFNPVTSIRFSLPSPGEVTLTVFDVLGRRIRTLIDGRRPAGSHDVMWNGTNDAGHAVAAGTYFYRLEAGHFRETKKMTLVE